MKLVLFILLAFPVSVHGAVIAYEKSTGRIVSRIVDGTSGYANDSNYGIIGSTESVSPLDHYTVNDVTKVVSKKSQPEIQILEDKKEMDKLLLQMLQSQKDLNAYLDLSSKGVDVAESTSTLTTKIEELKTDYDAIKNK